MARVFVSLGSNLEDRFRHLQRAVDALRRLPKTTVDTFSSVYETEPVGKKDQGDFLNAVLGMSTELTPRELSMHTKNIEIQEGRTKNERWGPRELDIDILYYDALILNDPVLRIPHPEIDNRRFVLIPLAEIAGDVIDPRHHQPVKNLLERCSDTSSVHSTTLILC
jgi:2-amino-4-hydroxy-6-hydroxymethyldihydropteridine diphosphokinase